MHVDAGRFVGAAGGTHDAGDGVGEDETNSGGNHARAKCGIQREGGDAVDLADGAALTELAGGES